MCTTKQSCSQCGPAGRWPITVWAPGSPARWPRSCQNCVKYLSERQVPLLAGTDFIFSLPSAWCSWVNSNFLGTIASIVWRFKERTQVSSSGMSLLCLAAPLAQQRIILLYAPVPHATGVWCRPYCMLCFRPWMFSSCSFSPFKQPMWSFCLMSSVQRS